MYLLIINQKCIIIGFKSNLYKLLYSGVSMVMSNQSNIFTDNRIHPRDKQDMGIRLSLAGRAVAYGQNVTFAGPFPTAFTVNTTTLTVLIEYDHGKATVKLVGKVGFEVRSCMNCKSHLIYGNILWTSL